MLILGISLRVFIHISLYEQMFLYYQEIISVFILQYVYDKHQYYMCKACVLCTCITGVWITSVIHLKYHTCIRVHLLECGTYASVLVILRNK